MAHFNQNFIDSIERELPDHLSMEDFIAYSNQPLRLSIRVNTLKISVTDFIELMTPKGWQFDSIPWCAEGFWITNSQKIQLGNTIEHLQGLFYIQEASSMLPPTALFKNENSQNIKVQTDTVVLDMASAPGSKTTQIAGLMQNKGLLVANEYSASRVKVLHANIARMGVANCALTHFDARVFGEYLFETFDSILLDAPCSGEGTIRKDPDALKNWDNNENKGIVATQKALIESAFLALKVGGNMVYSTCALSRQENQDVCNHLKTTFGNAVEFASLEKLFPNAEKACTKEGFLHVWPQIYDSEGFFVAKFTKKTTLNIKPIKKKKRLVFPFSPVNRIENDAIRAYFKETFNFEFDSGVFYHRDNEIWLFPKEFPAFIGKFKFDRIGIKIAEKFKKGFRAQHEWARAFGQQSDKNVVYLNVEQAKAYVMGRDISFTDIQQDNLESLQGEILVLLDGQVLGLAKRVNQRLKNNYPRDLVRDNNLFDS